MNQDSKLEQFVEKEFRRHMDHMILEDSDSGRYIVFGRYFLVKEQDNCVVSTRGQQTLLFSNTRNALAWCIADHHQRLNLATQISNLDRKQTALRSDIYCRRGMAEQSRTMLFYETVNTKLQPKLDQLSAVSAELEKCVKSAKYLQIRGFTNETARISGTKPKSTNSQGI